MLGRFWPGYMYRTFCMSSAWRNLEKSKPSETPTTPASPSSKPVLDMSMSFAPTEFDKKVLLLSGKFKSRQEIPPRIRFETMDNAKSRLRIRVANLLMVLTVLACMAVIFIGKKRQREGDSILKRMTDREDEIRAEAHRNKQQ